mmetsp:Transcript_49561/g.82878  ORF Transcript_49561/g.82878 Transcript_49561/m.82878 type:complete len:133 (-) Transcript_49561:7-405(-)
MLLPNKPYPIIGTRFVAVSINMLMVVATGCLSSSSKRLRMAVHRSRDSPFFLTLSGLFIIFQVRDFTIDCTSPPTNVPLENDFLTLVEQRKGFKTTGICKYFKIVVNLIPALCCSIITRLPKPGLPVVYTIR